MFISYSHDSEDHRARVLELAHRLRRDGFDAWIDRFSAPPIEGWPRWMERQVEDAQWVILVCTETYRRRFDQREEPDKGRGVTWEGRLVRGELYNSSDEGHRFIPITFSPDDTKYIPSPLAAATYYSLHSDEVYASLLRHMRREAEITPAPVGEPAGALAPITRVEPAHVQSAGAGDESPAAIPRSTERSSRTPKKVLIVAVNRASDARLALGREVREIATALRGATSPRFDVRILWAADIDDFRAAFLDDDPHILHFCGHGTAAGPILEDTKHGAERALQRWLKVALEGTRLEIAVLNFCDTHEMLDSLKATAPIVIGPTRSISDEHAITFSSVFYTALANGGSGSFAYHLGKSAVEMTPVESNTTRDVPDAPPPPPPGQYGIRCASHDELPKFTGGSRPEGQRTFAFFASEPEALPRQQLDQQLRGILKRPPSPKKIRVEQRWATRPLDFMHTLLLSRPAIVHVTGFGTADGSFRFEHDRYGQGVTAQCHALARVLAAFHEHIECAVLMFNHSCFAARRLSDVIGHVIAVEGEVSDEALREFAKEFYRMVWHGRPYHRAFDAAIAALSTERNEHAAFTLHGSRVQRKAHSAVPALPRHRDIALAFDR